MLDLDKTAFYHDGVDLRLKEGTIMGIAGVILTEENPNKPFSFTFLPQNLRARGDVPMEGPIATYIIAPLIHSLCRTQHLSMEKLIECLNRSITVIKPVESSSKIFGNEEEPQK